MVEGPHTVVELGEAGGHTSDGELGLGLGKPNLYITCPEFWELDSHGVDIERGSGHGIGHCEAEGQVSKKKLSIVETKGELIRRQQGRSTNCI